MSGYAAKASIGHQDGSAAARKHTGQSVQKGLLHRRGSVGLRWMHLEVDRDGSPVVGNRGSQRIVVETDLRPVHENHHPRLITNNGLGQLREEKPVVPEEPLVPNKPVGPLDCMLQR